MKITSLLLFLCLLPCLLCSRAARAEDSVEMDPFGKVAVYKGSSPLQTILFLSGDEGSNAPELVAAAQALARENYLVLGIDTPRLIQNLKASRRLSCPCGDLDKLNKYAMKTHGLKEFRQAILVGYGSGSTMAYAAMAQAPRQSFLGAISLGFHPEFPELSRLCSGYSLRWKKTGDDKVILLPTKAFEKPWIVFAGSSVPYGDPSAIKSFIEKVPRGELAEAGKDWLPPLKEAIGRLAQQGDGLPQTGSVPGVPTVEIPSTGKQETLVIILAGDGGWGSLDRDMAEYFSRNGLSVVGFDSLRYFWRDRTPQEASKDLDRVITYYLSAWKKKDAVLIGYSMGADALPFMVSRLTASTKKQVRGVVLVGLSDKARLYLSLKELENIEDNTGEWVLPELMNIKGPSILCIGGERERESLCRRIFDKKINVPGLQVELTPGGHMFDQGGESLAEIIVQKMGLQ